MKILHVISSADPRGGGPIEGIRQRAAALHAMGHHVELLTLDAPQAPWLATMTLPVHAVGPGYGSYVWSPRLKPWLRAHAGEYDAVVISGLWQHHGWATSRAMRSMGLPYHVFTHGMLDPWFKHTYPLKHLKKWVYWLLAEYHVLRHAQAVLFTSLEEKLRARASFGVYSATERVVDYGTNPPPADAAQHRSAFQAAHPKLTGKRLVLFLGRIHVKKGCDLLIHAFAHAARDDNTLHLVMAGPVDSALQKMLKRLASRHGVEERITWLGMVKDDAKWQALYGCDVFILPSHQENFGIAVAEALGCGLPVLLSDKVNIWREVVADGAGLVAPDTVDGTLHNLRRWLAMSLIDAEIMARQAHASFVKRFTAEAAARSLLAVLSERGTERSAGKGSR